MALPSNLLQFQAPEPALRAVPQTGTWEEDQPDGSVVVHYLNPTRKAEKAESDHNENIAELLDEDTLASIAIDLLEGIEEDDRSRAPWLVTREKAITLLAVELEEPRAGAASAANEGISTIRHPLYVEAAVRFQANATGELLPADGPVKIKDAGPNTSARQQGAVALEKASNEYLTSTATEYYPDSDRMFFHTGAFGAGIKKGYHCPIRRRPVIEAVDAKDLIVNSSATDLDTAGRVTHVIEMPPVTMKRMQLAGAYLDIDLSPPDEEHTAVDLKIASTQGVSKGNGSRPQDIDHLLYECHTEYDIPGFEHEEDGEATGLPLPYKITIDKTSRQILEIRRNWKEGDETLRKRRTFVMYSFVPMFGFWPYGLIHLLGNTTRAITAAWRIILDNGMFNNFATFLYAKGATNNETPNFKAAPGGGIPIDCPTGKLSDSVSPVPFRPVDPSFIQFTDDIAQTGQRLGGTAEAQVGEGNQQAPVGTTLAMIDQAQKIMSAVHKRIYRAQKLELAMFKELLQEDPEALWRHRLDGSRPADADLIIQALNDYDFVPVADPNTPTHMHRLMKTAALGQRADLHPDRYDAVSVETEILRAVGWDNPEQFFAKPPPPGAQQPAPPPDPNAIRAMTAMAAAKMKGDQSLQIAAMRNQNDEANRALKAADIQSRERVAAQKLAADRQNKILDITHSLAVHPASMEQIGQPGQVQ